MNQVVLLNGKPEEGLDRVMVEKYFKHYTATYGVSGSSIEKENNKIFYLKDSNVPVFITSHTDEELQELFRKYVDDAITDLTIKDMVLYNSHTIHTGIKGLDNIIETIKIEKELQDNKDMTYFIYCKTNACMDGLRNWLCDNGEDAIICYEKLK